MCQNIMYFPRRTLRTLCAHATAATAVTTVLPTDMTSLVVCPSKSAPQSNRRRRGGYRSHARSLAPDHPRVSISFRPSAHASNRVSGPLGDVIIAGREADRVADRRIARETSVHAINDGIDLFAITIGIRTRHEQSARTKITTTRIRV